MKSEHTEPELKPGGRAVAIRNMFSSVAGRYDLANRIMSLGRDLFWREALARRIKVLDPPGFLLDLAAGTGDQIIAAKKARPDMKVVGLDFSSGMLELAKPKLKTLPSPTPELVCGDALDLPFDDGLFDSVSISFGLRNIAERAALYQEVLRVLKPGGRFLVLEAYHDRNSLWAPAVEFYMRQIVPTLGGRIVSREYEAYSYLISSIMSFPRPEALAEEMRAAGFISPAGRSYTFNTVMLVQAERPGSEAAEIKKGHD